ncbi:hypothetical protein pb186bvf_004895 [Paramecium bursaria]
MKNKIMMTSKNLQLQTNKPQQNTTREFTQAQQLSQPQDENIYSEQDDDFEKFITLNLNQSKFVPQNNKRSNVRSYETPKQDKTVNKQFGSTFQFESFVVVQPTQLRKQNNKRLWDLMSQYLRIQLDNIPKQYVQINNIMVGDYDDSKVSKIIGELYDIEIYGDCAKATLKDSNGECKISIPADIFQEDEFKQRNNIQPKVTSVLEEIPRMDGIVIYAENVTVAKLGDDRFLILGKNNLKLVSY